MPSLSITLDHEQKRYGRDRIGISLGGVDLSALQFENGVYVVPVNQDLILKPRCLEPDWNTSNSAPYDKLGLADFGSPSDFQVMDATSVGAWPRIIGPKNTVLQTTATLAVNTGIYLSYFAYGTGPNGIAVECGWADLPGVENDVGIRIWLSGYAEVYYGNFVIGAGSLSGSRYHDRRTSAEYVEVLIMPSRLRELVIWSLAGNGFSAIIPDIDEDATSPVITPASKFWIKTVDCSCNIMVAPLKFATSGTAVSELFELAEAPDGSDTYEKWDNATWAGGANKNYSIYGDQSHRTGNTDAASASLVKENGSTAFAFDGTTRKCRIKTNLSGDGLSSASVYGVQIGVSGAKAVTDGSEESTITNNCMRGNLTVPDGGPCKISFNVTNPVGLSATVPGLLEQFYKPMLVKLGDIELLDGSTYPIDYERALTAKAEEVTITAEDVIRALKEYAFRERYIIDKLLITHATADCLIRRFLHLIGLDDEDMALETSTVRIGSIAPKECGKFNDVADMGASLWEIIERQMQDGLGGWHYGVEPTSEGIKFVTKSPTTINAQDPAIHLYWRTKDAITAGISEDEAWKFVFRSFHREVVENESNEINITGWNPRTQLPIGARKKDGPSQDPTIKPSLRPANWNGYPRRVGIINRGITRQQMANEGAGLKAEQLFPPREIVTFTCEFLLDDEGVPIWRGRKVVLHDAIADGVDVTTYIQSFSADYIKEPNGDDTWQWRPAQYVGSNIMSFSGGISKAEVTAWARANATRSVIQRRNSLGISLDRYERVAVVV